MASLDDLIDDLHTFALKVQDKWLIALAEVSKAMQFRAQEKWEESIKYFEKGCQHIEILNARQWDVHIFAKVLYEYAHVYLERDSKGDREKAHNILNEALELFQKLGAKKDIEKIIAKKSLLTA